MSNPNTEVHEHVHVKLHSSNEKTINIFSFYRALSHGVRARSLSQVKKLTISFSSRELGFFCRDLNIDLLKLKSIGSLMFT